MQASVSPNFPLLRKRIFLQSFRYCASVGFCRNPMIHFTFASSAKITLIISVYLSVWVSCCLLNRIYQISIHLFTSINSIHYLLTSINFCLQVSMFSVPMSFSLLACLIICLSAHVCHMYVCKPVWVSAQVVVILSCCKKVRRGLLTRNHESS